MNKTDAVFIYLRDNDAHDGGALYEARFQLPDDGTPGGEQWLVVTVTTYAEDVPQIHLAIRNAASKRMTAVACCEAYSVESVAAMLYKTARLVVKKTIAPA